MSLTSVVFPAPFSPTSATTAPAGSRSETSRRIGSSEPGYENETPSNLSASRIASGIGRSGSRDGRWPAAAARNQFSPSTARISDCIWFVSSTIVEVWMVICEARIAVKRTPPIDWLPPIASCTTRTSAPT